MLLFSIYPEIAQPQACDYQEEHGIFLQIDAIGEM